MSNSLPNIREAVEKEKISRLSARIVSCPAHLHMVLEDLLNEQFIERLNKLFKNSLYDPFNEPLIVNLNAPFNDAYNANSNDLNDNWNSLLKEPLNDPLKDPLYEILCDPLEHYFTALNGSLNVSMTNFLEKEFNKSENEELADDMVLHEPPTLQPPPNTPTSQFLDASQSDNAYMAPHAEMEEDDYIDSDDFEDSIEQHIESMDLHGALTDCERAITLFFNNRLDSAIAIMTPWKETSLYHAHGATILAFIPAVLTLEPSQIQRAKESLDHTLALCSQLRRSYTLVQSIGAIIKTPNYGGYSDEEAHAELVHAEAWLLLACLGVIENEDMTGFLRASLRIKTSHNEYRMCAKILERKTWVNEASRAHFESGVRLGLATFNVMIAMLPPRIIALLQFVGFSANKEMGKQELLKASQSPGLRSVLCELTLLVYFLIIGHFAAIPPDFDAAEKIISKSLKKYPDSVWFLMFKARTQLLRGKTLDSIATYQKTCQMQDLWPQLKHLAYWELVWAFAMLRMWTNAAEYAALLERESKWSRTVYMYAQAAMLIQTAPLSLDETKCIDRLLINAANHRQRILGRSLPMEKFVLQRCERWTKRGYLVLPGIEWLYLWNIFPAIAAESFQADQMLKVIEKTCHQIKIGLDKTKTKKKEKNEKATVHDMANVGNVEVEYDEDDLALAEFLRGSLLTAMGLPRQGLQHLEVVLKLKEKIQEHKFLIPYATVELASCHNQLKDPVQAVTLLQDARKKYSGYLLEARLHFRVHSKLEYIRAGIDDVPKRVDEPVPIAGADMIAAMKAKPQPSKTTNEANSRAKSEASAKTNSLSPNSKAKGNSKLGDAQNQGASVGISSVPGPSSASNTAPDWRSITRPHLRKNSVPVPNSETILSNKAEPMPSTSYADPFTKLRQSYEARPIIYKPQSSAANQESSVKIDFTNIEQASLATEGSNRKKDT